MNFIRTLYKQWWFWVVIIPVGAWLVYQAYIYYYSWKVNAPYRAQYTQALAEYAGYEAELIALRAQYAADFDGGKTPEETWDLFVTALKEGDTDQAAKYFIVEEQKEMLKNFEIGKKSGALNSFLNEDLPLIKGGTMYPNGERFEFYTGSIDNGPGFVFMLVKNPITGVWKIEDL
ncbi:hypothetical protein CL644_02385 [bacterium]|nr:hypothetical protein [Parcubacteria group bacterium]MBF05532.1 hypothetical protein [bacterium]|tara:strand:+ start:3899 stop:4423 length:525 start_codon:yes stop_codon:yes gene_type:complete